MGRRPHNSTDSKRYYDWLDRAEEDRICAGLLMQDDRCYQSCLFHCQQAIEKALKAYILIKSSILVDGHNLTWLCKKAASYDKTFKDWLDESAVLNHCYIETRYPADLPYEIQFEQVESAFQMAKDMYFFICEQVEEEIEKKEKQKK